MASIGALHDGKSIGHGVLDERYVRNEAHRPGSAALLIFSRSEAEDAPPEMVIVGVVLITVLVGVFLAIVVTVFPKVILWQWHLVKRL